MSLVLMEPDSQDAKAAFSYPEYQVQGQGDEVDDLFPGTSLFDQFKRWIIRKYTVSRKHPMTKVCLKSSTDIDNEINRHIRNYPCMIHPLSELSNLRITLMMIFTLALIIYVPFVLAFEFHHLQDWLIVLSLINLGLLFDIFILFSFGYIDLATRSIVLDRKEVMREYLVSFFLLDLISAIPSELMFLCFHEKYEIQWYWTAWNLFKIFRIRNLLYYSKKLNQLYKISYQKQRIIEILIICSIGIHWATCSEFYVALVGEQLHWNEPKRPSWITSEYMKIRNRTVTRYIAGLNRATIALASSSHYLPVETIEDIILNIFLTIIGRVGYTFVLLQFVKLIRSYKPKKKRNFELLRQLEDFMEYKKLSDQIKQRLRAYCKYWCEKNFTRNKLIIENVPPRLREDMLMHNYSKMMKNVEFFKHLPEQVLPKIVLRLKTEIYIMNDMIVKEDNIGDAFYYIESGLASVITKTGLEVMKLKEGSHFGEMSLMLKNHKHLTSVQVIKTCQVCQLKQSDLLSIIKPYPNLLNELQRWAVHKMDKSLLRLNPRPQVRKSTVSYKEE